MTLGKPCIFYQRSKCVLKGGFCDLVCNHTLYEKEIKYYEELDPFTKWRLEEASKGVDRLNIFYQ